MRVNIPRSDPIELIRFYEQFKDYYPDCEPKTKRWFVDHAKKDWRILDCGANIGYYTILFSRLASEGVVWALEPTDTYDMLLENLTHAEVRNVQPHKLALGACSGVRTESIFRIWGNPAEVKEYGFSTLDEFTKGFDRLDCVKIDTDSYDLEVLKGGVETLRRFNPFVVVEICYALERRGSSPKEALLWLMNQGYTHCSVMDEERNYLLRFDDSYPWEMTLKEALKKV
jgi:FkbM family methyltransferase